MLHSSKHQNNVNRAVFNWALNAIYTLLLVEKKLRHLISQPWSEIKPKPIAIIAIICLHDAFPGICFDFWLVYCIACIISVVIGQCTGTKVILWFLFYVKNGDHTKPNDPKCLQLSQDHLANWHPFKIVFKFVRVISFFIKLCNMFIQICHLNHSDLASRQ